MSKRESLARYSLIIRKLKRGSATFDEISDFLQEESELQGYDFNISKRTFQRDLNDIRSLYSIDIQFCRSRGVYYIETYQNDEVNERMLDAFYTFNALSISERLSDVIHFDSRKSLGTENLHGLLHAIKNRYIISFTYTKFYSPEASSRNIEPYGLKEYRLRWYVVGKDLSDGEIKVFALDRLQDLSISKKKFEKTNFSIKQFFKHSFGIVVPPDTKPQEVELLFCPFQGNYIKTLPLHHSQTILVDDEHNFSVRLYLHITHDFIMELLSLGDAVEVIKPKELREEMKRAHAQAHQQY